MLLQCLQALTHVGESAGLLFTDNTEEMERFKAQHDQPGRGVYRCVNPLKPGSRKRTLDNILQIERFVVDLDYKTISETPEEIYAKLVQLPLEPTAAVLSGGGWHLWWELREPVDCADGEAMANAIRLGKQLSHALGGDPAPTNPHSLIREKGSVNYKYAQPALVEAKWGSSSPVDITELEELVELLGDRPYLTYTAPARIATNGSSMPGEKFADEDLDLMEYGKDLHITQNRAMASKIARGISLEVATDEVMESTYLAAVRAGKECEWKWDQEVHKVMRSGFDFVNKHAEYRDRLPPDLEVPFSEKLVAGRDPKVVYAPHIGWHVRSYEGPAPGKGTSTPSASDVVEPTGPGHNVVAGFHLIKPFKAFDIATLPPLEFLYGKHYQRGTVGATVSAGGTGKTSLIMVESIAMATGRNLLGEQPEERVRCWYHNGEDGMKILNRRLAAICTYYHIPMEELEGWFYMTSGNETSLRVANGYNNLTLDNELLRKIRSDIEQGEISVAAFDPLVTLHSVPEQDNSKMDVVVRTFSSIADEYDCAIELAHHTRKLASGEIEVGIDDMRGASAVRDAVRSARTLNHMSVKQAGDFGIEEEDRRGYFRVENVKANNAKLGTISWCHISSVDLPCGGTPVGVVGPWNPPGQGAPTPAMKAAEIVADRVFLDLIAKYTSLGRRVNDRPRGNYAPKLFAEEKEAKLAKVGRVALEGAMRRLLDAKTIRLEQVGPTSKPEWTLVIS
jgi:hypothetical protein